MAGGGSHRGVSNGNNRGKPYGLMLLLAFGAALLGVMVIHKLRERRIFNLLVKDKDQQLNSLHFLLQKEREYTKELKSKNEEMKAKIYSLRTQKMELDRRILEMQSTIDSLKDEHKTMEFTLEDKQNEIKMLRDANLDAEKGTIQVMTLMESLKQKNAEIEDLKQRLTKPLKIWSVSTDDPSNPTTGTNRKLDDSQSKEVVDHLQKSNSYNEGANSTTANAIETMSTMLKNADSNTEVTEVQNKRMGIIDGTEVSRILESQKMENSVENIKYESTRGKETIENVDEGRKDNSRANRALGSGEERNSSNTTLNNVTETSKAGDARGNVKSGVIEEEPKINIDGQLGDEHSQQEILDNRKTSRGGLKMEAMETARSTDSKEKIKNLHVSKVTGKRWRTISRSRLLENSRNLRRNSFVTIKNRKFHAKSQQGLARKVAMASNHLVQLTNVVDSSTTKLVEPQNSDLMDKQGDMNQRRVVHGALEKLTIYPNSEVLRSKTLAGEANNSTSNSKKQNLNEVQNQENQEVGDILLDHINTSRETSIMKDNAEKEKPDNINRSPKKIEAVDRETATGSYREADLEENEEYKEETDESEF